ncbi:MAG: accessory gene regulator B family protein [Coprobacillus cateniformis]
MVSYSLEAILTTSITAISAFLLTAYTDCVLEYLIFNACFIPIRIRHKSFHFKKFIQCFICSNLMILLCCLILKYIPYHNTVIPLLLYFLLVIFIFLLNEINLKYFLLQLSLHYLYFLIKRFLWQYFYLYQ